MIIAIDRVQVQKSNKELNLSICTYMHNDINSRVINVIIIGYMQPLYMSSGIYNNNGMIKNQ